MTSTIQSIRESPNFKLYIVIGFCITTVLLFWASSSDESSGEAMDAKPLSREMLSGSVGDRIVGGLGAVKPTDDKVKEVVEKIKPLLEEKTGVKLASLEVIHYKTQVVAGTNYFVKAKAKPVEGEEQIVHLRIYQDLKRNLELTAHKQGMTFGDELAYFQ